MKITIETTEMSVEIRKQIAQSTSNRKTLSVLSKDEAWNVRRAVAENVNTSVETLSALAKDNDHAIRRQVACNPNTSAETLSALAKDVIDIVRRIVARHNNTSVETLSALAKDNDLEVRSDAMKNPNFKK